MQTAVFETLADPSRLQIVEALLGGECAVNDLVARMEIHQSGVSRHLRILEQAGFVQMRPDGARRLYLAPARALSRTGHLGHALSGAVDGTPGCVRGGAGAKTACSNTPAPRPEETMSDTPNPGPSATDPRRRIMFERIYAADLQDVWDLWTTKDGIESWWGPGGFAVTVRSLDLRPGGQLLYAMTAIDPPQIAFMRKAGMPLTQELRITYTEVIARRRLAYVHLADFIPGVEPYDVATVVELESTPQGIRMALTFDAMHSDEWTQRAVTGWEGELNKLAAVVAAGRAGGQA